LIFIGEKTGSGSKHLKNESMNQSINILPCSRKDLRRKTMKHDLVEQHIKMMHTMKE
jgi:hypothetical protein